MEINLFLWEASCLPILLNGAGIWTEISKQSEMKLDQIWNCFFTHSPTGKTRVHPGFTIMGISSFWYGSKSTTWEIVLAINIRNLNDLYRTQSSGSTWHGSWKSDICKSLNIEDCNSINLSQYEQKKLLLSACPKKNEERFWLLAVGKCERITREPYGRKEYLKNKNIFYVRIQ